MAAAPLGAFLVLCLLLPGAVPSSPPPARVVQAEAWRGCAAARGLPVTWGEAPARAAPEGGAVTLECAFRAARGAAAVTWERAPPPQRAWVTWPDEGRSRAAQDEGRARLALRGLAPGDAGTYRCRVRDARGGEAVSCGTALRVTPALPGPFLPLSEVTKNRVMAAEGILLLAAAVGPGLLLLLRKRWANERLLQDKKSCEEEENVYEGLTMEGGSLYESLAGGEQQQQLQYQDVGGLRGAELETP